MKSDQPCLLVTECTMVVEEDMAEGDSLRVEQNKGAKKQGQQFTGIKHVKLNEEDQQTTTGTNNMYTEEITEE